MDLRNAELALQWAPSDLAICRLIIETVLRDAKGNQVQSSELLGIFCTTLRAKLRSLGMAIEKQLVTEPEQADQ
jgi:hypothetical protein